MRNHAPRIGKNEWGYYVSRNTSSYLHSDGKWHNGTWNSETGKYSGYFKTRKLATEAIARTRRKR